jgi:hypothetical protein
LRIALDLDAGAVAFAMEGTLQNVAQIDGPKLNRFCA